MQIINQNIKDKIEIFILNVYWSKNDILSFIKNNICITFDCKINKDIKRIDIIKKFFEFIDLSFNYIEYYIKIINIIKEWNFNNEDYWLSIGKINHSLAKNIQLEFMKIELNIKKKNTNLNNKKEISIKNIKESFYSMIQNNNITSQKKGFEFEKIFYDIVEFENIEHCRPYRTNSKEQIDGSLKIENNNYLVELKFTKDEVNFSTLSTLQGKLSTKGNYPRGIFLSMEGFSNGAVLNQFSSINKNIILMDSSDFINILENRITLNELLIKKINAFQRYGYFYYDTMQCQNKYTINI